LKDREVNSVVAREFWRRVSCLPSTRKWLQLQSIVRRLEMYRIAWNNETDANRRHVLVYGDDRRCCRLADGCSWRPWRPMKRMLFR